MGQLCGSTKHAFSTSGSMDPRKDFVAITDLGAYLQMPNACYSNLQYKALQLLMQMDTPAARNAITTAITKGAHTSVRESAVRAFGKFAQKGHGAIVTPALRDRDEGVRRSAAEVLATIGCASDHDALNTLLAMVKDKDQKIRENAEKAIAVIQKAMVEAKIAAATTPNALLKSLKDPDVEVRRLSVAALQEIPASVREAALIECLKDQDPLVRRHAVQALEKLATVGACEALSSAAADKDHQVSHPAVEALAKIGAPAINGLVVGLSADSFSTVDMAARAVGKIGSPRAFESLRATQCGWQSDAGVRSLAVRFPRSFRGLVRA